MCQHRTALAAIVTLGLSAFACSAWAAGDDAQAAKAVLKAISAAQKTGAQGDLAKAVERVPGAHNGLENQGLRKKLQVAAGKVMRDAKAGSARTSAAIALGELDDASGAWKELRKGLPAPNAEKSEPWELAAIRATAGLAPEQAITQLLKLIQKGRSLETAKAAIIATGAYGNSKKREAILKALLDAMSRTAAAAKEPADKAAAFSWKELGEPLVEAANKLTGRKYADAATWLKAYASGKKKLGVLFLHPRLKRSAG